MTTTHQGGIVSNWSIPVSVVKYEETIAELQRELAHSRDREQELVRERDALLKLLARYEWRPISEIHEDYGPCVLMHLDDPGYLEVGSNLDTDFEESDWTHFAEVPKLTTKRAEELAAALAGSRKGDNS